jgi:SdrD B-like domain
MNLLYKVFERTASMCAIMAIAIIFIGIPGNSAVTGAMFSGISTASVLLTILLILGIVLYPKLSCFSTFRDILRHLQHRCAIETTSLQKVFLSRFVFRQLLVGCFVLTVSVSDAQITGTVFRDYNGNGIQGTSAPNLELGVAGIIVNAYNTSNAIVASYVSNTAGAYSIPSSGVYNGTPGSNTGSVANGVAVRLEFEIPTAAANICGLNNAIEYSSLSGNIYGSSVQFVSGGATNINFAINNPTDWVGTTNPEIITAVYSMGPIGASGRVQPSDGAIVRINNNDFIPIPPSIPSSAPNGAPATLATQGQVASVYGIAHHKKANVIFSSSFVRRHMPLIEDIAGSAVVNGSTGRIFITNLNNALPNGTTFIDVNTLGVNTGTIIRSDMATDFDWFCDADAALKVGKVGLGDIDIADDGSKLFFVNLFDRTVYGINLSTTLTTPVAGDVTNYAANAPWLTNAAYQCTGGVARPFALKYYRGKVYVGVVCTAENGGTRNDLYARVFELDPNSGTWTASPIVEQQLNYTKDGAMDNAITMDVENFQWNPWPAYINTSFNPDAPAGFNILPHPLVTDIEFDVDGSIIVGLGDRNGYCTSGGTLNLTSASPTGGSAIGVNCIGGSDQGFGGPYPPGISGGDVLRFGRTSASTCTYVVENNGQAYVNGTLVTASPGATHNGLGGGEFYHDGFDNNTNHGEIYVGGMAIFPGLNQLVGGVMDPLRIGSGGMMAWNSQTGDRNGAFELFFGFTVPSPSKSAGVGDVEFLGPALTNLEIGNRIWMDTDDDGIQDADEMGIGSIPVKLYLAGVQVGAMTTAPDGTFYFNNSNVNLNGATGILPNTAYVIRVDAADFPAGKSLSANQNIGGVGQPDVRDNDAALNGGNAEIAVTTGKYGENNHTLDMAFRAQTCSITLTPTVSGCYQSGGMSKATVSVEVAWGSGATISPTANDASDAITVTLGTQTRTVNPGPYTTANGNGTIVSPQIVTFEIDANGASGSISAVFANDPACTGTASYTAPAACPPLTCTGNQSGGQVFNDYNADGIQQAGETQGLSGVTVTAYDCNGAVAGTTTTDATGDYVFSGLTAANYPIRVEFSGLPALYGQGTLNGTDGRTTTQFVPAPDCNVDLGVLNSDDYCQTNPKIFIPIYNRFETSSGSGTANLPVLVGLDYNTSGLKNPAVITTLGTHTQMGSIYGVAYDKSIKQVFSAAVLRRSIQLGPLGLGGLYISNTSTNTTSSWIDVTAAPYNLNIGQSLMPPVRTIDFPNDNDAEVFPLIGKIGLGDIDISEDGQKLYFINLHEKKLHTLVIDSDNNLATNPVAGDLTEVVIPSLGCTGGNFRPFALTVNNGKIYIGSVCDASTSQQKNDLRAFIQEYNPNTNSFTTVFDFPLTYPKGFALSGNPYLNYTGWYPWAETFTPVANAAGADGVAAGQFAYPTPILTDLEFDIDGSMVIALGDRTTWQAGWGEWGTNDNLLYFSVAGGDILRAQKLGNAFVLENNAKAGPSVGYGPNNNQGLGFGEFYNDDFTVAGAVAHAELIIGSLALRPGSGEVLATGIDPVDMPAGGNPNLYFNSAGIRTLNNQTGLVSNATQVYTDASFLQGKSGGLGDMELGCDVPTYLQIGNYAWIDSDQDGAQDPCEPALSGLSVSLYNKTTNTLLAVTTTGANGEYYFTGTGTAGETWIANTGTNSALQPNTQYTIVFGYNGQSATSQYNTANNQLTVGGVAYNLTTVESGEGTNPDLNDSDAAAMAVAGQPYTNYPMIMHTTGAAGTVNHWLDLGVFCLQPTAITFSQMAPTCTGATANNNGSISLTGVTNGTHYGVSTLNSGTFNGPAFASATAVPGTLPAVIQSSIPNTGGSYIVRVFNGADGCFTDVPVTVPAGPTCVAVCTNPAATFTPTASTCTGAAQNNNGTIALTTQTNATHYGVSTAGAGTYDGPTTIAGATAIPANGTNIVTGVVHAGASYIIRVFNGADGCFTDVPVTVPAGPICVAVCTNPAATFTPAASTCTGATQNNNGTIALTTQTNATHYGVSTAGAGTYDGPTTIAGATAIPTNGTNIVTGVVHAGASYLIRVFNGADGCFTDVPVTVPVGPTCVVPCVTITNPSAAQNLCEGAAGTALSVSTSATTGIRFVYFTTPQTDATMIYTVSAQRTQIGDVTPAAGTATLAYNWSTTAPGTYYVYAILNPDPGAACRPYQEIIVTIVDKPDLAASNLAVCETAVGTGAMVDLASLVQNPDGATLVITEGGNPVVQPLSAGVHTINVTGTSALLAGCSTTATFTITVSSPPALVVTNGSVCSGSSIDLATLVTNTGGGTLSYYTNAAATIALASSTVSPTSATNYYVRSQTAAGCFTIKEVTVTLRAPVCGVIMVTGPN